MTEKELNEILEKHKEWLSGLIKGNKIMGGERAICKSKGQEVI